MPYTKFEEQRRGGETPAFKLGRMPHRVRMGSTGADRFLIGDDIIQFSKTFSTVVICYVSAVAVVLHPSLTLTAPCVVPFVASSIVCHIFCLFDY